MTLPYNEVVINNDLQARIDTIKKVFNTENFLNRDASNSQQIAKYYRLNRLAYKLVNSKQGFVHMGITRSDDFQEDDFLEHARIITGYIQSQQATNVLELAAGKAATTKYLATQFPDIQFNGLDLPNGQLDASTNGCKNLALHYGDYHDLSQYDDNSFEVVYIIEALCHAKDKSLVTREVRRVLKPGGVFIVFDGYSAKQRPDMNDVEILASDLTYTSMMVNPTDHSYRDFRAMVSQNGLDIIDEQNLSKEVLPSMRRLEAKAVKFFKHPRLARFVNKLTHEEVTGNAIAAYLMPTTVETGLHEYWLTVARKNSD